MTASAAPKDWKTEFGISDWTIPAFFASKQDVDAAVPRPPQAHALRRAFDRLKLAGVVCLDNAPTVYFRESQRSDVAAEQEVLRLFWNQGLAPILVVITDTEVRIHSSLALPETSGPSVTPDRSNSLVRTLSRVADASDIRQFVISVQSGEFFRANSKSFDPKQRVDRELLRNLRATREQLAEGSGSAIDPLVLDGLLCRLVFTCYLFDRKIIDHEYLEDIGIRDAEHRLLPRALNDEEMDRLWQGLLSADPREAHQATWKLAACTDSASFLAKRLRPIGPLDAERIKKLLVDLDADDFVVRERATQQLAGLGQTAAPALRKEAGVNAGPETLVRVRLLLKRLESTAAVAESRRSAITRADASFGRRYQAGR